MNHISTFAEALDLIDDICPARTTRPQYTLDYIKQLLEFLGNPQEKMHVVHVAGTSGKTSTSYYVAGLLQVAGKHVGLTVSPHAIEINDRVQIDGVPLDEKAFCAELEAFVVQVRASGIEPTYFELLVAFAFWEFHRQQIEYAVVEVGLGGLLDGTNVVSRADKMCVLTDIGYDHMHILGDTLPEIATQKAGIIQLHNTVFCYQQAPEIMQVFENRARQKQADLHHVEQAELTGIPTHLPLFQRRNFGLAREVVRFVADRDEFTLTAAMESKASKTAVPLRMETIEMNGKTVILDGAHNQQKLHALMESMAQRYHGEPMAALVSFVDGAASAPRITEGLKEIRPHVRALLTTSFGGPMDAPSCGVDADMLADKAADAGFAWVAAVPDPVAAFDALLKRPEKILLVTGSLYLLNHIRPLTLRTLQK